jgi:hypothetical protein
VDCSGVLDDKKKSQLSVDTAAEASIPLANWLEASPRLCSHVNKHYVFQDCSKVADAFQRHFSGIMSRFDFKSKFALYLEYDIHIHTLWVSEPSAFHPARLQEAIWARLVDVARDKAIAVANRLQNHSASSSSAQPLRGSGRGGSSGHGGQSFRGRGCAHAEMKTAATDAMSAAALTISATSASSPMGIWSKPPMAGKTRMTLQSASISTVPAAP